MRITRVFFTVATAMALCVALPPAAFADDALQAAPFDAQATDAADADTDDAAAAADAAAADAAAAAAADAAAAAAASTSFTTQVTSSTDADVPAGYMHRMYNPYTGEHLYTHDTSEKSKLQKNGWSYEGIGWIAATEGDPVYRLYNKYSGDHHYTMSATERDRLVKKGWRAEGICWASGGSVPVYREFNPYAKQGAHNYTTSLSEHNSLVKKGWKDEGIAWYGTGATQSLYRLYNRSTGEHLFTSSSGERNKLVQAGWKNEGVGWIGSTTGDPVYRLYNKYSGDHHYTMSASERDSLKAAGWKYEGICWRSNGSVPIYREFNPYAKQGAHNYTTSKTEHDKLVKAGWRDEGIAWYGLLPGFAPSADEIKASMWLVRDIRSSFVHGNKGAKYQKYIMIHDTEGEGDLQNVVNWWDSNGKLVAAHFVIGKDGKIVQCGELDKILHHAGYGDSGHNAYYGVTDESRDDKRATEPIGPWSADYGMNSYSIGIELVHVGGSGSYPAAQLEALDKLIAYIDAYYGFESRIIDHKAWRTGNSDTSPEFAGYLRNYQRTRSYKG